MRGHRDLNLLVVAAAICAAGSVATPLGAARVVFAVPLALCLPGYAITAATFGPRRPCVPELVALTVGISLAVIVLGSLLLNYTPDGLRAVPWIVLLLLVVLGAGWIAARRRGPATAQEPARALPRPRPAGVVLLAGGAVLAAAALVLAQVALPADNAFGYTELWMSPTEQSSQVTRVGVTSEQQQDTSYRLEVRIGDRPAVVRSFTLAPGESRTFAISHPAADEATQVQAELFKRGHPGSLYRHVYGWAPPAEGSPE